MPAGKWSKFEYRIDRQRREAERTAPYRDARNDAPRRPWIYNGFEEPPKFPLSRGSSVSAYDLESRLRAIDARARSTRGMRDAG